MNGNGYVAFDYLITALLWLATVMQAAVVRDRSITETEFADSCRWLIVAGTAGLAARFTFVLIDTGDIRLPPMSLVSIGVHGIGDQLPPGDLGLRPDPRHADITLAGRSDRGAFGNDQAGTGALGVVLRGERVGDAVWVA